MARDHDRPPDEEEIFDHPRDMILAIIHDLRNPQECESYEVYVDTCQHGADALEKFVEEVISWDHEDDDDEDDENDETSEVVARLPAHWTN